MKNTSLITSIASMLTVHALARNPVESLIRKRLDAPNTLVLPEKDDFFETFFGRLVEPELSYSYSFSYSYSYSYSYTTSAPTEERVSDIPSVSPTVLSTDSPSTTLPTVVPTESDIPTVAPTIVQSEIPTIAPTSNATAVQRTPAPTPKKSSVPSTVRSNTPSVVESSVPSTSLSDAPSSVSSDAPSIVSSSGPSMSSSGPSMSSSGPSVTSSSTPSSSPSNKQSDTPSIQLNRRVPGTGSPSDTILEEQNESSPQTDTTDATTISGNGPSMIIIPAIGALTGVVIVGFAVKAIDRRNAMQYQSLDGDSLSSFSLQA